MARKQQQQDKTRYCENCGISYIWTVEEQHAQLQPRSDTDTEKTQIEEDIEEDVNEHESMENVPAEAGVQIVGQALEMQVGTKRAITAPSTAIAELPIYCPGCRHLLPMANRERGLVKWYNRRKGYGFIIRHDAPEVYVNRNAIRRGHLRPDDFVEFTVGQNQQGPMAKKVTILRREQP